MKSLVCIGLIVSMVGSTSTAIASTPNSSVLSKTPTSISRINTVSSVKVQGKKLVSQDNLLSAELNVPVISGLLNFELQKQINSVLERDAISFKDKVSKLAKEYDAEEIDPEFKRLPFCVNIDYKVSYNRNNFLSLYIDYYEYTGGAHGSTTRKCYNIDLKTGKLLNLKDIFSKNSNYKEIINETIKTEIQKNPEKYFEESFQGIVDDQCFVVEGNDLVIYFQQYEIAPYASGILEFKIPFSKIKK
ncbi:DUF3298 and DUF4163 domain-containing protein [Clostridium sp. MB40-C1]|uniref:DUF3298 and DUF4163 domain-containing protein n=1 Tax=Clostridium sp. MB40-C1 TaxID=3070996 RepID=UPI0027E1BBF8|nr:DUF3298 and DUF4163 domain-containing protein [Clostridium sp. MB40-C1]WMJ79850.1 DUF3298 and DUF4163 domain-containing protein [Clostridium sp. MB40-C1]